MPTPLLKQYITMELLHIRAPSSRVSQNVNLCMHAFSVLHVCSAIIWSLDMNGTLVGRALEVCSSCCVLV